MPHVVLSGNIELARTFEYLEKLMYRDQKSGLIVRIEEYFINKSQEMIIARAVAVDGDKPQTFYINIMKKEFKTTIRLDPLTNPEKTDGVKLALAMAAKNIQKTDKEINLQVTKTNIQEYLDRVE